MMPLETFQVLLYILIIRVVSSTYIVFLNLVLDLEKPSPYMGDWQMVRHMLYFLGGFTALFILSDKFGISRREKIIAVYLVSFIFSHI
jgi:hypothetical protein